MATRRGWSQARLITAVLAVGLLVFPALLLLSIAVLRMSSVQGFPSRFIHGLSHGIASLASRVEPALLFIVAPAVAALVGAVALVQVCRSEPLILTDTLTAGALLRRRSLLLLLTLGTFAAGLIVSAAFSTWTPN